MARIVLEVPDNMTVSQLVEAFSSRGLRVTFHADRPAKEEKKNTLKTWRQWPPQRKA